MAERMLFHGTSSKFKSAIMRHGLRPRALSGRSTYTGPLESNGARVYLTDVYAPQFALLATGVHGGAPMIVGVAIDEVRLLPDSDFEDGGEHHLRFEAWEPCLTATGCVSVDGAVEACRIYLPEREAWADFAECGSHRVMTGATHAGLYERHAVQLRTLLMCSRRLVREGGAWLDR